MNQKQTGGWLMSSIRSPSRTKNPSPTSKKRSQLQNQSQSQNGGRRRKNTMWKLRRGRKSRKVMRGGGGYEYDFTSFESSEIRDAINKYKVQKGNEQPLSENLDKILENEIGKQLSESTDINPASKLGIMLILNPTFGN